MKIALGNMKLYIALFAVFFLVESVLALWTGHEYDTTVWFNTGEWISQGTNIYIPPDHIGYPPLWALWCGAAYNLYLFFGTNIVAWRFFIKLPLIIAHLALAYLVGRFAEERFGQPVGKKIFLFTLTWSFFVFVGALWGQINAVSALLTFLAFEAVVGKQTSKGALFLGLATALKIYPIVTLPAFLVYTLRNRNKQEATKFLLFTVSIPVLVIISIFAVFQWDLMYFVRTVFYSTPTFESSLQWIQAGCMNTWSFIALLKVDMAWQWPFRLIWLPLLLLGTVYWFRKSKLEEAGFVLSIISFYVLFMVSFGWVSEQTFLDLLPFAFLFILAYNPKRVYLYFLAVIQLFVYIFTLANQNLYIFKPLLIAYSPSTLEGINQFYNSNGAVIWNIRGVFGLVVSVSLLLFLAALMKPTIFSKIGKRVSVNKGTPKKASEPAGDG